MQVNFGVGRARVIKGVEYPTQSLSHSLINCNAEFMQCHVISSHMFTNLSLPSSKRHISPTGRGAGQRKKTRYPQGGGEGGGGGGGDGRCF